MLDQALESSVPLGLRSSDTHDVYQTQHSRLEEVSDGIDYVAIFATIIIIVIIIRILITLTIIILLLLLLLFLLLLLLVLLLLLLLLLFLLLSFTIT